MSRANALGGVANYEISIMRNGVKSVINLPRMQTQCAKGRQSKRKRQPETGRERQGGKERRRL